MDKNTSQSGYNGFVFGVTGAHEETLSNGKVLARPNVTTFDGRQAKIMMGDKVPVFTSSSDSTDTDADTTMTVEYKDVGIQLDVLPRINEEDKETITMVIKPSVSTITEWVESGNNKAPQISERSAETTIRVKSGETILLGGLLKEEEIKNIKQIPILAKIPLLGELFKSRSLENLSLKLWLPLHLLLFMTRMGVRRLRCRKCRLNCMSSLIKCRMSRKKAILIQKLRQ